MYRSTALAVVTQALILGASAQNNTNDSSNSTRTCSEVGNVVKYNSSSTRTISAVKLSGPRPTAIDERFGFDADSSHSWELSLRVQKQPEQANASMGRLGPGPYQQVMFLDTGSSNMTDVGSCHQTIQAETGAGSFQWTKEVMELSYKDSGDCMTLLGNKCVKALKKKAQENAALFPLRNGRCTDMNSSMPLECSGTGMGPQLRNRQMNLTYLSGVSDGYLNSQFDPSLECNGVNVSSTHSVTVAERMAYDPAVRFPVIDVITFWPNRSLPNGLQSYDTRWPEDVLVEVVCMRPDEEIAKGSETPPEAFEILGRHDISFPTGSSANALRLGHGALGKMSAIVMGVVLVM